MEVGGYTTQNIGKHVNYYNQELIEELETVFDTLVESRPSLYQIILPQFSTQEGVLCGDRDLLCK